MYRDISLFSVFAMLGVGQPMETACQDFLEARLLPVGKDPDVKG